MVELTRTPRNTKKRRALQQQPELCDRAARYPASFHFSALTYKQASESLCVSPHSVVLAVPTPPSKSQCHAVAGDLFSLDKPVRKVAIPPMEHFHKQHTITHLQWDPKGKTVASVDETGRLALWRMEVSTASRALQLLYSCQRQIELCASMGADL